jgi:hypothetical protein
MEGLAYDFGVEDDEDKDAEDKQEKKSRLLEVVRDEPEDAEKDQDAEDVTPSKERLLEIDESEAIDTAPELNAEAPLEHISEPEAEAISQTIAVERLDEVHLEIVHEPTHESLAAESFLENVEATGDIDRAYSETLVELGESPIDPTSREHSVEIETAMPVDPVSLVEAARSELGSSVSHKPAPSHTETTSAPSSRPETKASNIQSGIVDYLVGRRFARITEAGKHDEIEAKLNQEVSQIRLAINARETHIREVAQDRQFTKQEKPIKTREVETIGKVLIDAEMPEAGMPAKSEEAAISAHTIKRSELLKVAASIKVEGSSLKQIYEAHLVGEKGLRRIVAEYLRGGNFKKTLKRELLEREKDFERDPKLRDQASTQSVSSSNADLENLLQRSGIDWSEAQPAMRETQAKTKNLTSMISQVKSPTHPFRRVADIIMVGVIAAMAIVIGVLLFTR